MNLPVTFTPAAVAHIQTMLAKENKKNETTKKSAIGFFLSIKKTGCSGYAYVPTIVYTAPENALHYITAEGLAVWIDRESERLLQGIVVDFVEDKTGLHQKRLVFINPNEKGRCGCGESFTV